MDSKEFKKDFDEMVDLLEKAKHESKSSKNSALFTSILFYFVALDEEDVNKPYVMKRLLNLMDLDYFFRPGLKFNFDKSQSIEFAKYLTLVDLDIGIIADVLDLTIDEVKKIKKE